MNRLTQELTLMGIIGEVSGADFALTCRSGDTVRVRVGRETRCAPVTNLDLLDRDRVPAPDGYRDDDVLAKVQRYVEPGRLVLVEGVHHTFHGEGYLDARTIHLAHARSGAYLWEETHWWLTQMSRMADKWLDDLFRDRRSYRVDDFAELYRTNLNILGLPTDDDVQEMATLSRLIYGLSSAFLLTGNERYLLAARAGVDYHRLTFRSMSHDGAYNFWAHGKRRGRYGTRILVPSESSDDAGSIPLYEQIYALAGLAQFYRITGDWEVLEDIRRTIRAIDDFYLDEKETNEEFPGHGGYFSHLDYGTMRPDVPALGDNRSRKNWNSIGDHIPAYLVNVILALDPPPDDETRESVSGLVERCRQMLDRCTRLILDRFPDSDPTIPYVQERFHADWSPDREWRWQQDRAVVGHNFKISWNLIRVANYYRSCGDDERADECARFAVDLADRVTGSGIDLFRGGCFDVVERRPADQPAEFAWRNTKDFWQQEQALLAFWVLYGETRDAKYLDLAREQAMFWNAYFLDRDRGGINFRVTDNGVPVVGGQYGDKGGHAIAGYHSFELNYLAHLYTRLFQAGRFDDDERGFCLYFRPARGRPSINVLPDFIKPGDVKVDSVRINGLTQPVEVHDFCVVLPADLAPDSTVVVRLKPTAVAVAAEGPGES